MRFIFKRILLQGIFFLYLVLAMALFPLWSAADEDPCGETGIFIRNETTIDLWYTRNGGPCTFWGHDHILILESRKKLVIYQDMACKMAYCSKEPTYDDYESLDANQNCRVQILPFCNLQDM